MQDESAESRRSLFLLIPAVLLVSMAAGMGWGIRGQYGHETGAMIAGALASVTLVLLFVSSASSLFAARASAMMTVAIGIGGSMTYGQTVGLTHNEAVLGNWEALRWGLLGLLVKGAIWIGFAGACLGMGLSGKRYYPLEMAILFPALLALMFIGVWLINSPFDPSSGTLPWIYFSADWYFEPGRELQPRPEVWGGLLIALVSLIAYARFVRRDRLAGRMAWFGMAGGGIGFPLGQCVQAFPRWNPEVFSEGVLSAYNEYLRHFNWWNMMETTFGLVFGATLALGLWLNRRFIASGDVRPLVSISPPWEVMLCVVHLVLLLSSEFLRLGWPMAYVGMYTEFGLLMATIPMIGIVGGRYWPYLMLLPIVTAPIVGKTIRNLTYENEVVRIGEGWLFIVQIPMAIVLCLAVWLIHRAIKGQTASRFASITLLTTTLLFYWLNTAYFRFAWPWQEWTNRTANQIIFSVCAVSLVLTSLVTYFGSRE